MDRLKNKVKTRILISLVSVFFFFSSVYFKVSAQCINTVPNPLDPNCESTSDFSLGTIGNRLVGLLPYIIAAISLFVVFRSVFKLSLANDDEQAKEAYKGLIRLGGAMAAIYSLGMILFFIDYLTGANIAGIFL